MAFSRFEVENFFTTVLSKNHILSPWVDGTLPLTTVPAYTEDGKLFFVAFDVLNLTNRLVLPVYMDGWKVKYHGYSVTAPHTFLRYTPVAVNDVAELFNELFEMVDDFGKIIETGGLNITVYWGDVSIIWTRHTIPDTALVLQDNILNYVVYDYSDNTLKAVLDPTIWWPYYKIAEITTSWGVITSNIWRRSFNLWAIGPQWPQGWTSALFNETPTGLVNWINKTYTISATPAPQWLQLYRNGILQNEGVDNDYTFTWTTITFNDAPLLGDILVARIVENVSTAPPWPQGNQWYQWLQGNQGKQGNDANMTGPQGNQGNQWQWNQGNQGPQGVQWKQWFQWYQGNQSSVVGPQGVQWVQGTQGNQWDDATMIGPQGNQWNQWVQWTQWTQGNQGYQWTQWNQGNQWNSSIMAMDSVVASPWSAYSTTTLQYWVRIYAKNTTLLHNVTKQSLCDATTVYLQDDTWTQLATASFVWDSASFSYIITAGTYYRIVTDSLWWTYTISRVLVATPISWVNIDYNIAIQDGGAVTSCIYNIISITTWPFWDTWVQGNQGSQWDQWTQGNAGGTVAWKWVRTIWTPYVVNDAVSDAGSSYVCILDNTGNQPPNLTYWNVIANVGSQGNQWNQWFQGNQWTQWTQGTWSVVATDSVSGSWVLNYASTNKFWVKIYVNNTTVLHTVTKNSINTAIIAYLQDNAWTQLATAPFVWDSASFSYVLTAATNYRILTDKWWASHNVSICDSSVPVNRTNINYVKGIINGSTEVNTINNIVSIVTWPFWDQWSQWNQGNQGNQWTQWVPGSWINFWPWAVTSITVVDWIITAIS